VWRILDTDAIKPWRYKYWILPRDLRFAEQAGPMLDLYAGLWQGQPLGPKDSILSADEKTIDLQEINRKCRAGLHEKTGVSQHIFFDLFPLGGYTREHQDTVKSGNRQSPPYPFAARL
jgi:hypothetical protein